MNDSVRLGWVRERVAYTHERSHLVELRDGFGAGEVDAKPKVEVEVDVEVDVAWAVSHGDGVVGESVASNHTTWCQEG